MARNQQNIADFGQCPPPFMSLQQEEVDIPAVAADQALPDIIVSGLPTEAVVIKAQLIFMFGAVDNVNAGDNSLDGVQHIQVTLHGGPEVYASGIQFEDAMYALVASIREGGNVVLGDDTHDLSATVVGNGTYHVKWTNALAHLASIKFNNVQVGLRLWYR